MKDYRELEVFIGDTKVGTLAAVKNHVYAFEYEEGWIRDGFAISPFSLPLEKKVFVPNRDPFEGVFGAFADSLPVGLGKEFSKETVNDIKEIVEKELGDLIRKKK